MVPAEEAAQAPAGSGQPGPGEPPVAEEDKRSVGLDGWLALARASLSWRACSHAPGEIWPLNKAALFSWCERCTSGLCRAAVGCTAGGNAAGAAAFPEAAGRSEGGSWPDEAAALCSYVGC